MNYNRYNWQTNKKHIKHQHKHTIPKPRQKNQTAKH